MWLYVVVLEMYRALVLLLLGGLHDVRPSECSSLEISIFVDVSISSLLQAVRLTLQWKQGFKIEKLLGILTSTYHG